MAFCVVNNPWFSYLFIHDVWHPWYLPLYKC